MAMTKEEVMKSLCFNNPLNPTMTVEEPYDETKPCSCDNCFYGRTKLATEVLHKDWILDNIVTTMHYHDKKPIHHPHLRNLEAQVRRLINSTKA